MKLCKNCNNKIEDDALVCPHCGCVTKKERNAKAASSVHSVTKNKNATQKKGRKTWLWVLGWICFFPLPLTILLFRSQKLKKGTKIAITAVAWIAYLFFFLPTNSTDATSVDSNTRTLPDQTVVETNKNIKGLSFSKTADLTVKVGKSISPGYLKVDVRSKKDYNIEDIEFRSVNSEIATIVFSHDSSNMLYFDITGISAGETDVYAILKDGTVKSENIHVIVPEPIGVDSIELSGYKTELCVSQSTYAKALISPHNAEDKVLTWASSDENVVIVDTEGNITAISGGTATISATANNGVTASFDINVDETKTLMKLNANHYRTDDVNIGDEWSYDIQVNGDRVNKEMGLAVGEKISFYAQFTESDDKPDVGQATTTHVVTEDDIENGFVVTLDVFVTENGGRNRGKSAHYVVTYTFS